MSRRFSLPRMEGEVSRQAHADLPPGTYEREIGREGFFGPATHMYHAHPPTSWSCFDGPLRPRAFDAVGLSTGEACPWSAHGLMSNAHLRLRVWKCEGAMDHLVRNADGDELLFIHQGSGSLFCDYGHLGFREGDYVLLPRGTLWRLESDGPLMALLIEATGSSYRLPERGLLGEHALFDPAVLETPHMDEAFRAQQDEREWRVLVKARDQISTITYPYNPLDAVGWKGSLSTLRLNWRDIRPVVSARYHLPPSAHTTFVADRFVICTFCPRPLETDPGALNLPFFHSNDDYDELIFYHRGGFISRDHVHPGMFTLHPCGFAHGPQPKALAVAACRSGAVSDGASATTDEVAVMLDARDALDVAEAAEAVELPEYVNSWRADPGR